MGEIVSIDNDPLKISGGLNTQITNSWASGDRLQTGVAFCHWRPPAVSGESEQIFQDVLTYASYALIIWNAYETMRIFDMRYDIAKAYGNLAQDRWNRFNQTFKPLEAYMINQLMNDPLVEADYETARDIYTECAESSMTSLGRMRGLTKKYCLCLDSDVPLTIAVNNQLMLDDMVNLGYQDEQYITPLRDIDRWNRRSRMLNLGRDLASISTVAARAGDEILDGAANAAVKGISDSIGFLNYIKESEDTVYSRLGVWMTVPSTASSLSSSNLSPTYGPMMTEY
jgi:hypothetical protein